MQITYQNTGTKHQKSFCGFAEMSAAVEQNAVLNRTLIEGAGVAPWAFRSNNKHETRERLMGTAVFSVLAFAAPIINVPLANRISMRMCGLTNSLGDNNHKAIQLSNKYLTSADETINGLKKYNQLTDNCNNPKISERFFSSPLEKLYKKIFGQKEKNTIDINALLKKCKGNKETLRRQLSKAKNWTLCSDLLITCFSIGFLGFFNNWLTKKLSGRSGFSAELEMADEKIITERAKTYEKNKKKNMKILASAIIGVSAAIPLITHKGLLSKNKNKFSDFVKKHATLNDYTKGLFMSRFIMLVGTLANISGLLMASRNNTERKDWGIRCAITCPILIGGDLVAASAMSNISDKILKTKLTKTNENKGFLRKIFPKFKSLEQIGQEVTQKKIAKKNKGIAVGIYWGSMALCAGTLAYLVPNICNKMIKHDVQEHIKNLEDNKKQENVFKSFNN